MYFGPGSKFQQLGPHQKYPFIENSLTKTHDTVDQLTINSPVMIL